MLNLNETFFPLNSVNECLADEEKSKLAIIGASLSEPHTYSVMLLNPLFISTYVCMYACMYDTSDDLVPQVSPINIQTKGHLNEG